MGNSSSRKKDKLSRRIFHEVNVDSNFVIRDVMDPCLRTFDDCDFQDLMYELNHAFPETYPEGFTELNLNLDLVRKYPAQKLDRKLWRKINKRSSIQFTGSIVDDAHCQEDNDMSYKDLVRELNLNFGEPEPECEETQWLLTNTMAPYATVARNAVAINTTSISTKFEGDDQDTDELMTMLRELGMRPTSANIDMPVKTEDFEVVDGEEVFCEIDAEKAIEEFLPKEQATLDHNLSSDEFNEDSKRTSESCIESTVFVDIQNHKEVDVDKHSKDETTGDNMMEQERHHISKQDCENGQQSQGSSASDVANDGCLKRTTGNSNDINVELKSDDYDVNVLEEISEPVEKTSVEQDQLQPREDNVNQGYNRDSIEYSIESTCDDTTGSSDKYLQRPSDNVSEEKTGQKKNGMEFKQVSLRSVADRMKDTDNVQKESVILNLSEEEARRRAALKLERKRSNVSSTKVTGGKKRTLSMAPNGRVAHMMAQFGEQWLLEAGSSSDEDR